VSPRTTADQPPLKGEQPAAHGPAVRALAPGRPISPVQRSSLWASKAITVHAPVGREAPGGKVAQGLGLRFRITSSITACSRCSCSRSTSTRALRAVGQEREVPPRGKELGLGPEQAGAPDHEALSPEGRLGPLGEPIIGVVSDPHASSGISSMRSPTLACPGGQRMGVWPFAFATGHGPLYENQEAR